MKKIIAILLTASALITSAISASAVTQWEEDAPESIGFSVPYSSVSPTIDGSVGASEYTQLDFSDTEKYYNYYYDSSLPANTLSDMKSYAENDMKAYTCWDNEYLYFALQAKAPKAEFYCNPSPLALMFRHWCLQIAITDTDATGEDRHEIGIGCNESDGKMYTVHWGTRKKLKLKENVDYAAVWDRESETVTYELRLKFTDAINKSPETKDMFKFSFLLSMGNGTESGTRQIQLGKGIAKDKLVEFYPVAYLTGSPTDTPAVTDPTETEPEDITDPNTDALTGSDDFRDTSAIDNFDLKNDTLSVENRVEGDDKFIRLTANADNPSIGGTLLTNAVNFDTSKVFAIRYRTSSEKAARFGVKYTNKLVSDIANAEIQYPDFKLISDGQWHTIIFDMTDVASWGDFPTSFYLCPFDGATDVSGETIDIMWIKYYNDPEIYFADDNHDTYIDDTEDDETTDPSVDSTTGAIDDETTADTTSDDTTAAVTTGSDTSANSNGEDDGEGSSTVLVVAIIIAAVALVGGIVAFVIVKKKKN